MMILMTSIIGSWTILFFGYKIGMDSNENNLLREGNAYTFTCDMRFKEELNVKCTSNYLWFVNHALNY